MFAELFISHEDWYLEVEYLIPQWSHLRVASLCDRLTLTGTDTSEDE